MLVDQLVASVKNRVLATDTGFTYSDAEIRTIGTERFTATIVPIVLSARESYLNRYDRYVIAGSNGLFLIPQRAAGGAIHSVRYIDPAGNAGPLLPRIDDAQRDGYGFYPTAPGPGGGWTAYYFDGDRLRLWPPLPVSGIPTGFLEVAYMGATNALVDPAAALAITAVNSTTFTVSTAINPSSVPIVTGAIVDIIGGGGSHDWRVFSGIVTNIAGAGPYVLTITNADGSALTAANNLLVGDYIAIAKTTPVPMCADELHPLLSLDIAYYVMEATHDGRADVLAALIVDERRRIEQLLTPRSDQQPMRIVNRFSAARARLRRGWGW